MMNQVLYQVPLFEEIPGEELQWMLDHSEEVYLEAGDFFVQEGDALNRFYIVLDGELQVTRTVNGTGMALGTTPRGIIGGELALLYGQPSLVSARAILPSRLMVFDQTAFRQLFSAAPTVGARIFRIAAERTQNFAATVKQQEKMAALGKLAAGLAHELNNPASAARRAANTLREMLPTLQVQTLKLNALGLTDEQLECLVRYQHEATARPEEIQPLSTLEQSGREDEIADWLDEHEIPNGWEMASTFVDMGFTPDDLSELAGEVPPESVVPVVQWLYNSLGAVDLLNDIEQSSRRISDLVGAIKSYTYMDQAPRQEVDIHKGLENTLTMMGHKLKGVTVNREYDTDLPRIVARGGELNQVWTNLIDNAIDATDGKGTISLITRCENDYIMVEVADDGEGIPKELMPRLFEPFFTTKEVGAGTGMGLDISYQIIRQHNGTIEVQSEPGHTRFIVRLPIGATAPL